MKKSLLFIAMMVSCTLSAYSQLLVDTLGNVGIKAGDSIVKSTLSINHAGDNTYDVYVYSKKKSGMYIYNNNSNYTGSSSGLRVYNTSNFRTHTSAHGIYSEASNEMGNIRPGYTYGVYGKASLGEFNYGVFGSLPLNKGNGAAVCGSIYDNPININGQYAGYFYGNVFVTGNIYNSDGIYTVLPTADEIVETVYLADEVVATTTATGTAQSSILEKLSDIETVRYNVISSRMVADSSSATLMGNTYTRETAQTIFGVDAATLQAQFPSLVKNCNDSLIAVDYIGLIPLLLQSIKELQEKVTILEGATNKNSKAVAYASAKPVGTTEMSSTNIATDLVASLSQNTPNPFSETTTIAFTLPASVKEAMLCIYDMNGKQLEQITIAERGASSVQIEGYKFSAGMYLYSLIADGTVIDTKRMVLTK